ncbi:caspase-3-like [Asterias amurensis]|uniref:caspase-3-like n=1 Tax=Asterias amurensis TaxID=7602 RepID=UPI003AB33DA9
MEQAHKDLLRKHRVRLVQDLDIAYVFDGLVEKNIFEPADYEDFEAEGKSKRKMNQRILTALEKRGPNAFDAFIWALRQHKQGILADLLDPSSSTGPSRVNNRYDRLISQPTDSSTGPAGDVVKSEPMDVREHIVGQSVIASPSAEGETQLWLGNSPAVLTDVEMQEAINDSQDSDQVYTMKSKPRGIAAIINNKHFRTMNTRKGTNIDGRNLKHVFTKLGFNVIEKEDQTGEQIQQFINDLSIHNHESFDGFILAVLSHGIEGAIYGVDERVVKIENITGYFEGKRCPSLAGKPKLFFLQACRGERFDSGIEATDGQAVSASVPTTATANDSISSLTDEELAQEMLRRELEDTTDAANALKAKLPSQSDMLLAFATVPGFVSWRNSERGSWFVQALSEVFLQHAHNEDLLSMMTMVNNKVAKAFESSSGQNKQIPAPVTMLRKKLFFNPGK